MIVNPKRPRSLAYYQYQAMAMRRIVTHVSQANIIEYKTATQDLREALVYLRISTMRARLSAELFTNKMIEVKMPDVNWRINLNPEQYKFRKLPRKKKKVFIKKYGSQAYHRWYFH